MLRIIAIILLCFIVVNLFAGLFHILRDGGKSTKTVRVLAIRVALSVLLFLIIVISAGLGIFPE